jgi:cytochrome d ubiquinol oxidase subunit II
VAFDFRRQDGPMQRFWDRAFSAGSAGAAFFQGIVLGTLLQGVPVAAGNFAGSALETLGPLPLLTGVAVLAAYAVLGAAWARWRLGGADRAFADRALGTALVVAVACAVVAIGTAAIVQPALPAIWAERSVATTLTFVLLVASLVGLRVAIGRNDDRAPFLWALGGAASALLGLLVVVFPYAVPFAVDLWSAASPSGSMQFYLIGAGAVIPVILAYTAFAYWTFRGKIEAARA